MFGFRKKQKRKVRFDKMVLRKNDISLLILDERWNNLFANKKKSDEIISCETEIKNLLKLQSRLIDESKEIVSLKRSCMNRIIALTEEAYDKENKVARDEMLQCRKEIKRINGRLTEIESKLEELPEMLNQSNLKLLEHTVNVIYYDFRKNQRRKNELEKLIEETRSKLKLLIEEKKILEQDNTDVYSYFHDLLGGEELEKLDRVFFIK